MQSVSKFSPLPPQAAAPRQQSLASLCSVCLKLKLSAAQAESCSKRRGGTGEGDAISHLLGSLILVGRL